MHPTSTERRHGPEVRGPPRLRREARKGIRAARFIVDQLGHRGHDVTLVDPLKVRLPLLDRMYKELPKGEARPRWSGWPRSIGPSTASSSSAANTITASLRAEEHPRPLSRGVFLSSFSHRLLLGRLVRRRAGGDAAADDTGRARHRHHPISVPDPQGTGRVRRVGQAAGPPIERRIVRFLDELEWFAKALQAARAVGAALLSIRPARRRAWEIGRRSQEAAADPYAQLASAFFTGWPAAEATVRSLILVA